MMSMRAAAKSLLALLATSMLTAPFARADSPTRTVGTAGGGNSTGGLGTIATCSIVVMSGGFRPETVLAAGEIANETAAFVCDQSDLGNMTVDEAAAESAQTVAVIAARLVAQLSVNCFATGMSNVIIGGRAFAEFQAFDLGNALAANITEFKVCNDCNDTVVALAENFTDIMTNATANATFALNLATDVDTQEIAVEEFVEAVTEVFVVNFTQVLIRSRSGAVDEGCEAPPAPMTSPTMKVECDESMPVADNEKCAGADIDTPKSCASRNFLCVTRGSQFAACRKDGIPPNDNWEGIVFECV